MFDLNNVRSHWPLLSYINNPIASLRHNLETSTYEELKVTLDFNPMENVNGVDITYRHLTNIIHSLYARLSTIYCVWENGKEIVADHDIRRIMISINYDIYEAYLHMLKLGSVYLPSIRANPHLVGSFTDTLNEFAYRANAAFPEELAYGIRAMKNPLKPGERERLLDGSEIPDIALEREFLFHYGTSIELDNIAKTVDLREHYNTEHPSVGNLLEMLRILEITIERAPPEEFLLMNEKDLQVTLLTLMYTFGRWKTYTVATLLKDDQVLHDKYLESQTDKISFRNFRDVEINNIINPLLLTATSIN